MIVYLCVAVHDTTTYFSKYYKKQKQEREKLLTKE